MPGKRRPTTRMRQERDSLGAKAVPAAAYYGIQTARAVENFPISGLRFSRPFLRALGLIKQAAAEVNMALGRLDRRRGRAIVRAAGEVAAGRLDAQFVVDIFQTGSATSTNMNANEVIANRAAELVGELLGGRGNRQGAKTLIHPNDHVNLGQSSNDVIPTAIHLAALTTIHGDLLPALGELERAFRTKAGQFMPVIKTGRTHLQDAVPIRLGQEFLGYAGQVERARRRVRAATAELREVALGGTAVGTGVNTHPRFALRVCRRLTRLAGVEVVETTNHFQAQACLDAVVFASGAVRTLATALIKIANDLRWMGAGPRAGLGELVLPSVQPGSSIMPGKVNPVIPESAIQACAQVIGNDVSVAIGNAWGNFELNTMMPVMAHNLLESLTIMAATCRNLARQCVKGLKATRRGPAGVEQSLMLATALAPTLGYDRAAEIAKEALRTGKTVKEIALQNGELSRAEVERLLDPERMV